MLESNNSCYKMNIERENTKIEFVEHTRRSTGEQFAKVRNLLGQENLLRQKRPLHI